MLGFFNLFKKRFAGIDVTKMPENLAVVFVLMDSILLGWTSTIKRQLFFLSFLNQILFSILKIYTHYFPHYLGFLPKFL